MSDSARYDALLEAGCEPPAPCPVCTGEDAEPCSEECEALVERCHRERVIRGHYEDARRALRLAREYRHGDHSSDLRVKTILRRVYYIRQDIASVRRAS